MSDSAQMYIGNPLHDMDDEELVSRVCISYRDMMDDPDSNKVRFKELRLELMYRLRRSHIELWTPPQRFPQGSTAVNDLRLEGSGTKEKV